MAALGIAVAILLVPLWCVSTPAMPDYPAHLAGFYLIKDGARSEPLSSFYAVHWMLLPNLASELVVPLFARITTLEVAAKLFLSLAVAMWAVGPAAIQRALTGRLGAAPLAGALFAYNANFTWGFFNYYFGAGLSFLVFAAWIASARRRGPFALAGFAAAVFALYVCHLFAVCLLAVMIGCFELSLLLKERSLGTKAAVTRALAAASVFLPVAFVFVIFKSAGGANGAVLFDYADTFGDRLGSVIQWYYSEPAYLVIGALAILILAGLIYGKLRVHADMKLLVLTLAVLTLVAPEWAFGGWGVDLRLPAVLGAIIFAALELRLPRGFAAATTAMVLLVAGGCAYALTRDWVAHDRQYREFRAALEEIPKGSKLFTVLDGDALDDTPDQPYWHMAEFAIIDRGAFTPLMFATKGQHIVSVKPPYDGLAAATAEQGSPPDVTELVDLAAGRDNDDPDIDQVFPYLKFFQCHFDEVVVIQGKGEPSDVPAILTLRHAGTFFSIYDVHPNRACSRR